MNLRVVVAVAGLTVASCAPYPSTNEVIDDVIVVTNRNTSFDFARPETYAVVDRVPLIKDGKSGSPRTEYLPPETASRLIGEVVSQMNARGYTQVAKDQSPHLGVNLTASINTVTYQYYEPGYWGGVYVGWGYWYSWGWYYSPGYTGTSSYQSGTVLVELVDLQGAASVPVPDGGVGALTVTWGGLSYGVSTGGSTYDVTRAIQGIDQSFEQSPYVTR